MKSKVIVLFLLLTQFCFSKTHEVYVFVWESTQTKSGAGHSSIAFKTDNGFEYFSHYPESDGGGKVFKTNSFDSLLIYDSKIEKIQAESPNLVLKFTVSNKEFKKMNQVAHKKIKKKWSLFVINCADFVKQVFRKSKYDTGLAFGISTPYEMIKDIRDHNIQSFQKGKITVQKGFLFHFLTLQPRAVPYTLKKWFKGLFKK